MALFHTTVLDNQIKALDAIGSVSGAICTFDTDRAERLVNLEVAITATGGGGTPVSPIAINGFSACNLSVNGTTETIPFGQTIYGGRLNVGSGVLTVTHGYVDIGDLEWAYNSSLTMFLSTISGIKTGLSDISKLLICSSYATANYAGFGSITNLHIGTGSTLGLSTDRIAIMDTNYTDANTFKTALTGQKIVYELATPTTIQLDSKQIQAIIGTNNIYSDTGDIIDLKFVLSVGQAIS